MRNVESISDGPSSFLSTFSLIFWFSNLYNTLAIAVNRLLAISYPIAYTVWFSTRTTVKVIVVCWTLGVLHTFIFFFEGCDVFYLPSYYIWMYAETDCGAWIATVLDLGYGAVFFCLIFILNVLTALKLKRANQVNPL